MVAVRNVIQVTERENRHLYHVFWPLRRRPLEPPPRLAERITLAEPECLHRIDPKGNGGSSLRMMQRAVARLERPVLTVLAGVLTGDAFQHIIVRYPDRRSFHDHIEPSSHRVRACCERDARIGLEIDVLLLAFTGGEIE